MDARGDESNLRPSFFPPTTFPELISPSTTLPKVTKGYQLGLGADAELDTCQTASPSIIKSGREASVFTVEVCGSERGGYFPQVTQHACDRVKLQPKPMHLTSTAHASCLLGGLGLDGGRAGGACRMWDL